MAKVITSRNDVVSKIFSSNGKIMSVQFIKRTDGTIRVLRGRLGVKAGVKGIGAIYDFKENGLIPIHLMNGDENRSDDAFKNWRTIPIEGVQSVTVDGITYEVK